MKPLAGRRVLVAMSGGVDSSAAAALLLEQGAVVEGATTKNFCLAETDELPGRSCCSVDAIADARTVCAQLGIPHRVVDETARFREQVIDDFAAAYAAGRTPNPCLRCNSLVRFPRFVEEAAAGGFDAVATGHYARLLALEGRLCLARAIDGEKDQSYFLAAMDPALYARLLFPLGALTKAETRAVARRHGLHVAEKRESQDVCFLGGRSLRDYLGERALLRPGPLLDEQGRRLGEHAGAALLTVGQRHGLGLAAGAPRYVLRVDTGTGEVVVGEAEALIARRLRCGEAWLHPALAGGDGTAIASALTARIRHRGPAQPLRAWRWDGTAFDVDFATPVRAAAPGQSLVLYAGECVVGHGIIERGD
ncbi:tRNA 2-thiouridine(34) synthase MnmA [bacterium]|nr:tRNA 2-thiouridine(34) synthase MnmA [bacterium]